MKGENLKKSNLKILIFLTILILLILCTSYLFTKDRQIIFLGAEKKDVQASSNFVSVREIIVNPVITYDIDPSIANYREIYGKNEKLEIVVQLSDQLKDVKNSKLCIKFGENGTERIISEASDTKHLDEGIITYTYTIQEGDNGELKITYFSADGTTTGDKIVKLTLPQIINKNSIIVDTEKVSINKSEISEGFFKEGKEISTIIHFSKDVYTIEDNTIKDINKLAQLTQVWFKSNSGEYKEGVNSSSKKVEVIDSKTIKVRYTVKDGDNGEFNIKLPMICDIAGNLYTERGDSYVSAGTTIVDTIKPKIQKVKIYGSDDIKYYTRLQNNYIKHGKVDYEKIGAESEWTNSNVLAFANEGDKIKVEITFDEAIKVDTDLINGLLAKVNNNSKKFEDYKINNNTITWEHTITKQDWNCQDNLFLDLRDSAVDKAGNKINLTEWSNANNINTNIYIDTIAPTGTFGNDILNSASAPKHNGGSKKYYGANSRITFSINWGEYVNPVVTAQMPLEVKIGTNKINQKTFTTTDNINYTQQITSDYNGLITAKYTNNVVTDLAGNFNNEVTKQYTNNYVDKTRPTVEVKELEKIDNKVIYKITLNDGNEDFQSGVKTSSLTDINNIVVTNGQVMTYTTKNGNIDTITVLNSVEGYQRVYVKENAFTDNVLNKSNESNVCEVIIDNTPPQIILAESGKQYEISKKDEKITIGTTLTVIDNLEVGKIKYAWSKDNTQSNSLQWSEIRNSSFASKEITGEDKWYLWICAEDTSGNTKTIVSGAFEAIYKEPATKDPETGPIKINTNDNSNIKNIIQENNINYLVVNDGTTAEQIKKDILVEAEIIISDEKNNKEISDKEKLKTNNQILIPDILGTEVQYIISVKGDLTGDGTIDMRDLLKLNKYRNNLIEITKAEIVAGDVVKDNEINMYDILKLNSYRLGKIQNL